MEEINVIIGTAADSRKRARDVKDEADLEEDMQQQDTNPKPCKSSPSKEGIIQFLSPKSAGETTGFDEDMTIADSESNQRAHTCTAGDLDDCSGPQEDQELDKLVFEFLRTISTQVIVSLLSAFPQSKSPFVSVCGCRTIVRRSYPSA